MLKKIILIPLILLGFTACSSNVKLAEKCFEKPDPGMCRAYMPKYFFNEKSKNCEQFIWGGCKGNVPFESLNECKKQCEK